MSVRLGSQPSLLPKDICEFALRTNLVSSPPVQKLAAPHSLTDASPAPHSRLHLGVALTVLFLAALWFGLCRELSGEWSVNEQYNFGWFVPFFALYLFWLRWQDRPQVSGPAFAVLRRGEQRSDYRIGRFHSRNSSRVVAGRFFRFGTMRSCFSS